MLRIPTNWRPIVTAMTLSSLACFVTFLGLVRLCGYPLALRLSGTNPAATVMAVGMREAWRLMFQSVHGPSTFIFSEGTLTCWDSLPKEIRVVNLYVLAAMTLGPPIVIGLLLYLAIAGRRVSSYGWFVRGAGLGRGRSVIAAVLLAALGSALPIIVAAVEMSPNNVSLPNDGALFWGSEYTGILALWQPQPWDHLLPRLRQDCPLLIGTWIVVLAVWHAISLKYVFPGTCRMCGYDLRICCAGRCPECGTPSDKHSES